MTRELRHAVYQIDISMFPNICERRFATELQNSESPLLRDFEMHTGFLPSVAHSDDTKFGYTTEMRRRNDTERLANQNEEFLKQKNSLRQMFRDYEHTS